MMIRIPECYAVAVTKKENLKENTLIFNFELYREQPSSKSKYTLDSCIGQNVVVVPVSAAHPGL